MTASPDPRPVRNLTLREQVLEHLREEILSSRLEPGAELNEVALSQELGVSRGPIREALGRLAAEGLVTIRPRRGALVRALSGDEFAEAYQVREALEWMAVRLAVPRLREEDLGALQRLVDEMEEHAARDEVEQFFEQRPDGREGRVPGERLGELVPHLLSAPERGSAPVAEPLD
jgi:DNA-binding GntR family transcriptional regulator